MPKKNFFVMVTKCLKIEDWECNRDGQPYDTDVMFDECMDHGEIASTMICEAE